MVTHQWQFLNKLSYLQNNNVCFAPTAVLSHCSTTKLDTHMKPVIITVNYTLPRLIKTYIINLHLRYVHI